MAYRIIEDGQELPPPVKEQPTPFGKLKQPRGYHRGREYKKRDAPCKACPHCGIISANGVRVCSECGYEHFQKVTRK